MLLNLENLCVGVFSEHGEKSIVHGVSFSVDQQQILGVVGGSGSGKSTTGLAILRLLTPPLVVTEGKIVFQNQDLFALGQNDMRRLRGGAVAMVFQEPLYAFNPVFTIGDQIDEVLVCHTSLSRSQRRQHCLELLDLTEIPDPARISRSYPHQLSGGLRQRAMMAQALAGNPRLLIADEPTSNLDVTIQAKIMNLFVKLKKDFSLSIILITHDLGLVQHFSDSVVVMKEGSIVEQGKTNEVIQNPRHEYTRELMRAL